MNPQNNDKVSKIEDGVNSLLSEAKHKICNKCETYEDRIRESPGKAVMIALGAGYCLNRLPIRSIVAANVRLIGALAPPALLVYGAAKVCEYLQQQGSSKTTDRPSKPKNAGGASPASQI